MNLFSNKTIIGRYVRAGFNLFVIIAILVSAIVAAVVPAWSAIFIPIIIAIVCGEVVLSWIKAASDRVTEHLEFARDLQAISDGRDRYVVLLEHCRGVDLDEEDDDGMHYIGDLLDSLDEARNVVAVAIARHPHIPCHIYRVKDPSAFLMGEEVEEWGELVEMLPKKDQAIVSKDHSTPYDRIQNYLEKEGLVLRPGSEKMIVVPPSTPS